MESKILTNKVYHEKCEVLMPKIPTGSVDMIMTDPPYNLNFLNTSWDKALPSKEAFLEMFRVLKPGAFCFVFSSPRQDLLYRMTRLIEEAGFMVDFPSIYWTYATGIGLAANCGKLIDKRSNTINQRGWFGEWLCEWRTEKGLKQSDISKLFPSKTGGLTGCVSNWELGLNVPTEKQFEKICLNFNLKFKKIAELKREIVERKKMTFGIGGGTDRMGGEKIIDLPASDLAKEFDGAYIRYRPKPCLEIILVAMKPVETKTYIEQVMKNGHACTWLDRCRVPVSDGTLAGWRGGASAFGTLKGRTGESREANRGRYPTNLLVQHDLLDTGEVTRSNGGDQANRSGALHGSKNAISLESTGLGDSGSFSRYFCFDSWCREKLPKTYPFLPVPKPSASTKVGREAHLTEKPVQIFAYLVTLASRPGDLIGDFYAGSGSSLLAAAGMNRDFIGCDKVAEHVKMAEQRLSVLLVNREKKEIIS